MTLTLEQYAVALRSDGAAIAGAARTNLDADVPSCPGWTMRELVVHTAGVYKHKQEIVEDLITAPHDKTPETHPEDDQKLIEWFEGWLAKLVDTLDASDPKARAWNWSNGEQVVSFWHRRMAQETAVHRWDAQNAVGVPAAVEPELAADGIDEILDAFMEGDRSVGPDRSVHIHCTDMGLETGGEWLVTMTEGKASVSREHAKGDCALRGPASDLFLALWGRLTLEGVELLGDRGAAEALIALLDTD
ncbi:MAG: maleylpyruvate isomerase family mycothiol-dependent enzyme [Actinomycetota bacterium]